MGILLIASCLIPLLDMFRGISRDVPLFALGFYQSIRFGHGRVQFVMGPGGQVDLSWWGDGGFSFLVHPGIRLGADIRFTRFFGMEIRGRPFFTFGVHSNGNYSDAIVGGGMMLELGFYFYTSRGRYRRHRRNRRGRRNRGGRRGHRYRRY